MTKIKLKTCVLAENIIFGASRRAVFFSKPHSFLFKLTVLNPICLIVLFLSCSFSLRSIWNGVHFKPDGVFFELDSLFFKLHSLFCNLNSLFLQVDCISGGGR